MQKNRNPMLLGLLLAGACLAPLAAQASPVVSMELTGFNGASLNQVYTAPYYGLIGPTGLTQGSQFTAANSNPVAIYCDDFFEDVQSGQVWQATVTNLGQLSSASLNTTLMFHDMTPGQQASSYMTAAWLAEQIAGGKLSTLQAEQTSYALWYVFDNQVLSGLTETDQQAVLNDYQSAVDAVKDDAPSDFYNVNIYTPLDATPGSASSQEYLTVGVPEPDTLALLAVGLVGLGWAARRRRRRQLQSV